MREILSATIPDITLLDEAGLANQLVSLPTVDIGHQSKVGLIAMSDFSEPVLLKRAGVNKDLTRQEARHLQSRLTPYREELREAGWQLSQFLGSQLVSSKSEWQVWLYEQYIPGLSLASFLKADGAKSLAYTAIGDVVSVLASYDPTPLGETDFSGQKLTRLPHGIDLQPSNVVIADTGGTYLVDIFAPKELTPDGGLLAYSPKLDTASSEILAVASATRQGALLRFLRKTQQEWTLGNSSSSPDDFIEDVDELLALSALPAAEVEMVMAEVEHGYPLLDDLYQTHYS